jgi:pyridinium-3,5-biscarboxylic acid mononucleotide sulfurtransferase
MRVSRYAPTAHPATKTSNPNAPVAVRTVEASSPAVCSMSSMGARARLRNQTRKAYTEAMTAIENNRRTGSDAGSDAALDDRMRLLRERVRSTGGLAVAFSGGVDSTLLAFIAREELGDRALAVTARSPTYPSHEEDEARRLAAALGIRHEVIESNELEIPGFADNPPDRCYACKQELFARVRAVAERYGIIVVADGTNTDDAGDYRPGRRAACEAGVISPLAEAGMGKTDIRVWSRRLGLPTAEKPAYACLASRFPYGETITPEKLSAVDRVEMVVRRLGFAMCRVRHHGSVARIEVPPDAIERFCAGAVREAVSRAAHEAGFAFIALDLDGYRTGSMNATLPPQPSSAPDATRRQNASKADEAG